LTDATRGKCLIIAIQQRKSHNCYTRRVFDKCFFSKEKAPQRKRKEKENKKNGRNKIREESNFETLLD